jgi:hypothetical protein
MVVEWKILAERNNVHLFNWIQQNVMQNIFIIISWTYAPLHNLSKYLTLEVRAFYKIFH